MKFYYLDLDQHRLTYYSEEVESGVDFKINKFAEEKDVIEARDIMIDALRKFRKDKDLDPTFIPMIGMKNFPLETSDASS